MRVSVDEGYTPQHPSGFDCRPSMDEGYKLRHPSYFDRHPKRGDKSADYTKQYQPSLTTGLRRSASSNLDGLTYLELLSVRHLKTLDLTKNIQGDEHVLRNISNASSQFPYPSQALPLPFSELLPRETPKNFGLD